jgi:hypothetical protein
LNIRYKNLFSVTIEHDFYDAYCPDFDFLVPADTQRLLRNGKLLCRIRKGILYCLYEANNAGNALHDLSGRSLIFGLKLKNPYFKNFTRSSLEGTAIYRNQFSATALDAAQPVSLTGTILLHEISDTERPVTLKLLDANDNELQSVTVPATHNQGAISFELSNIHDTGSLPGGLYRVSETYSASSAQQNYYYQAELNRQGVFGLLDIAVNSSFYTTPADFGIHFLSRQETLKYYVIAKNYSDAEFTSLTVNDAGFSEESRPQINFSRVASGAFSADEIPRELLGDVDDKIALFKSSASVNRQQKARKKIQLSRNGDVLISDLPSPGSDRARADLFIHVVKP